MPSVVIFDLGGVLIEWNPRHLYRKLFDDEAEMERFLAAVTPLEWNEEMDAGRPWDEGIAERIELFPYEAERIRAYRERWPEMLGPINQDTVQIMEDLVAREVPLYALTNWAADTFEYVKDYPFFRHFEGILVSGREGLKKPDPKIYELLLDRYDLAAEDCAFIDDSERNIVAAEKLDIHGICFTSAEQTRAALAGLGLL
ncbi:MAG: HAD-IA family hydrolase [Rhodothermales bacterium]